MANSGTPNAKFVMLNDKGDDFFQLVGVGGNLVGQLSIIDVQPAGQVVNVNSATASTTLTAANLVGAYEVVLNMSGALAAGGNATLPTVAALVAALPGPVNAGQTYKLRICNNSSGAFAWTVLTNTGWTLSGTMTIGQNKNRDFAIIFQSATAATLQSLGGTDGAL